MSMQFSAVKSATDSIAATAIRVFRDELVESFYPGGWMPDADGIPNPHYRADLDINLSNANAGDVAHALGWRIVGGYLEVPISQAIEDCTAYLKRHIGRQSPAVPPRMLRDGPLLIECGRREGYLEQTIHRIALMLRVANQRGATHLTAA
jgi:hypothetical protein